MHNIIINVSCVVFHAAVRIIDPNLKASVELAFPPSLAPHVRTLLTPLFSSISVTSEFIFIPSFPPSHLEQEDTAAVEKGDTILPSVVLSLITHLPHTTAAESIQEVLNSPDWQRLHLEDSTGNPFKSTELFYHKEHRTVLPLFSLTSAQLGSSLEESLQLTLVCGTPQVYTDTVKFYKKVLDEPDPASQKNYVRFSLKRSPTSNLSLCIYMSQSFPINSLSTFSLHCYVTNLVSVVIELVKEFGCGFQEVAEGVWLTRDPAGNCLELHDKNRMTHAYQ